MKIGLLGGTFDPIHNGHVRLGESAKEVFSLDEIWFLPAGQPYLKEGKKISSAQDRLAMTHLAIEHMPYARVDDIEMKREGKTYTYETIEALKETHPEDSFFFIIGADCLEALPQWKHPERILAGAELIAASRGSGSDLLTMGMLAGRLMEAYGGKITLMPFVALDISSTLIRARVRDGLDIQDDVPQSVYHYIREHGLYLED